jgi:hypothetical protein
MFCTLSYPIRFSFHFQETKLVPDRGYPLPFSPSPNPKDWGRVPEGRVGLEYSFLRRSEERIFTLPHLLHFVFRITFLFFPSLVAFVPFVFESLPHSYHPFPFKNSFPIRAGLWYNQSPERCTLRSHPMERKGLKSNESIID